MTKQLRSIGPISCAKVAAIIYGVMGLIFGAFFSLLSVLGVFARGFGGEAANQPGGAIFGLLFGIGAVILFPLVYACLGAIGGVIMAGGYNLVARLVGGIELEIE